MFKYNFSSLKSQDHVYIKIRMGQARKAYRRKAWYILMKGLKFRTSKSERLSYGGFFLGQNIFYVLQFQYLTYFYTEYVGLRLRDATTLLLITKIWDACNDPIMGAIVDKCNFKKGKYLPWLKIVTYLLPISVFLLFVNVNAGYSLKLIFAYATYIIFDMVYTMSDSPIFSLATVMTDSIYERDTLISYGRVAAAVAAILSAPFLSVKAALGWTQTAALFCFAAFLFMVPLQFKAKEREKFHRSSDITFRRIFRFLFKNKYLLIYYFGYLAVSSANTLQAIAVYFAKVNLGDEGLTTLILAVSILPVVFAAPFLPALIKKFGKRKLTVVCSVAAIILSFIQYYSGYDNLIIFLAIAGIRVAFMEVPLLAYGMFTADCIEYGAYINGERTEGIAFSIQTFITKLGGTFSSAIALSLLGLSGYVEKAALQSAGTLKGIWIIMNLVPITGYIVMIVIMYFYKLDEKAVEEIRLKNKEKLGIRD